MLSSLQLNSDNQTPATESTTEQEPQQPMGMLARLSHSLFGTSASNTERRTEGSPEKTTNNL